jgi:membrane protein DedA with SNARE-associated domain
MNTIAQFVLKHGYSVLFAALFAHQIGVPLPGPVFLLVAGALAASGKVGIAPSFGLAVVACVLADWVWYEAGRRRGRKVLHFIHSFTADPAAHDRRAKETFARYGLLLLVVAKFVPGLDAVTPPLAGISRTSRLQFFAFDAVGATFYSGVYGGLGYVFSHDLDRAAAYAGRVGTVLAGVAFAGVSSYALRKLVLRHGSAGDLRHARAFIQLGVATVRRRIASALIRDWPLVAISSAPWSTICTPCAVQEKELAPEETENAAR